MDTFSSPILQKTETLNLLQSTVSDFEYFVKVNENNLKENFNTLISSSHSLVDRKCLSSINKLNNLEITRSIFFCEKNMSETFKSQKSLFLNLAMMHFKDLNESYKKDKNRISNEKSIKSLEKVYGNTEIFKSFSSDIHSHDYFRAIKLPKFGSQIMPSQTEEFVFKKIDQLNIEEPALDDQDFFLKVNVPITYNQIIKLCLDTLQRFENNSYDNKEDSMNTESIETIENTKRMIDNTIMKILSLEKCSDIKVIDKYRSLLSSLFYLNAVLYISNYDLNENGKMLFSATPVNYLTFKVYFRTRIIYISPPTYIKEMQFFKRILINRLSKSNIHRFLYDSWIFREMNIYNSAKKRPYIVDAEENFYFNKYSKSSHLISCYSFLEAFKKLSISLDKNDMELNKLDVDINIKKESSNSYKTSLRNDCLTIIIAYLSLVYGMSWVNIKILTYGDIINLILGVIPEKGNIKTIRLIHLAGLPSIVLHLLGIQQSKINLFLNSMRKQEADVTFLYGPLPNITIPTPDNFLIKESVPSGKIEEIIQRYYESKGVISDLLSFIRNNYFSASSELSINELHTLCEKFFETILNELNMRANKNEEKGEDKAKYFKQQQEEQEQQHQYENLRNSPLNNLITIKKIKKNNYRVNNIGDMTLLAMILLKKHIGFEENNKLFFPKDSLLHFQKRVKDMIIQDYVVHGGFKLPGEKIYDKKFKSDFHSGDINLDMEKPKLKYPISHPTIYDYQNIKSKQNKHIPDSQKYLEKNLIKLMTTDYAVDTIRTTSLNFVLRFSSETLSPSQYLDAEDKNKKLKDFINIIKNISENYKDLPQMFILKSTYSINTYIFDKELSSYKNTDLKALKYFFMNDGNNFVTNNQPTNIIEKTHFFYSL